MEYGTELRPDAHDDLVDALQISSYCNSSEYNARKGRYADLFPPNLSAVEDNAASYFVDWTTGSDTNSGVDPEHPVKSVSQAVKLSRHGKKPATIFFLKGTHYVEKDAVQLGPEDSDLTFQNYDGAEAWLSGGWPLTGLQWKPYDVINPHLVNFTIVNNTNNIMGVFNTSADPCSKTDTMVMCETLCANNVFCTSFTWHDEHCGQWANDCCFRTDGVWVPVKQNHHFSGYKNSPGYRNVYVADISSLNLSEITGLRVGEMLKRVPRARCPNADPETAPWPEGWFPASSVTKWLPGKNYGNATEVQVTKYTRNITGSFLHYGVGIGGPCVIFEPPVSYWCQSNPAGGGGFEYYMPSGVALRNGTLANWTKYDGAVVQAWRAAHWASWMFAVDRFDHASQTLTWAKGGFQGARGGPGAEWFVEGVLDELDSPNEWYYDAEKKLLYFYHNTTTGTPPPADMQFVATQRKVLFNVSGTQENPVRNLHFQGLGFRDTAYTYLDPHGVPSGGDWALERFACIILEGTELAVVNSSKFERLDGNGVILNGYNRNASLTWNEFVWLGSTAMASWGRTDELSDGGIHGVDGTDGNFPRFTTVGYNIVHEIGIWEKQSSAWFEAKTAQSRLMFNVFFNMPRAGVNLNDGFGGGTEVVGNLILNICRESSDHGPINSWDRQPYLTTVRTGEPSVIPLYKNIHRNFLVSDFGGGNGGMDNDDGSTFYEVHDNFEVYGVGPKPGGGALKYYNNVRAYVSQGMKGSPKQYSDPSYTNAWYNITAIFRNESEYYLPEPYGCGDPRLSKYFHPPIVHNNTIYHLPSQAILVSCGGDNYTIAEFQKQFHLDLGSRDVPHLPSDEDIISWARQILLGKDLRERLYQGLYS